MTTKQKQEAVRAKWREAPEPLPDPPLEIDAMKQLPTITDAAEILRDWFAHRDDVLVGGQGYLCIDRENVRNNLAPDYVVALGVDPDLIYHTNGYVISEVGKPPDFVLEVASESTGRRDYTEKRERYAEMGVLEYWRFDPSGGQYHDAALAGDRLSEGVYIPFPITELPGGEFRGYSPTLGLYLCWVDNRLWFIDPAEEGYVPYRGEVVAQLKESRARGRQTEAERDEERSQRIQAEERADAADARAEAADARADAAEARAEESAREAERLREILRRLQADQEEEE